MNAGIQVKSNLWQRILVAMLLCLAALTVPLVIATAIQKMWGLSSAQHNRLQSLLVSLFVVAGIWQLRAKFDRGVPASIGIGNFREAITKFLLGFGLLLTPLLLTLLITSLAGWGKITFHWESAQTTAIPLGMLSVLCTDALPEELIFRGYIFSNLQARFAKWKSAILTTLLFVLFPVVLIPIQKLLGSAITTGLVNSISVGYLSYMLFFGIFAIYLRVLTGSIWTGVGFHLMFVYINQLIGLESSNLIQISDIASEAPVQITMIALLCLTFIALLAYPRIKGLPIGWRETAGKDQA